MRIPVSKKVFLVFFTLTAITLLLGATVYVGTWDLQTVGKEIRVVKDFQFQIKELASFQLAIIEQPDQQQAPDRFQQEIGKAEDLLHRLAGLKHRVTPELQAELQRIPVFMDYYRKAYLELFAKHQKEHALIQKQRELKQQLLEQIDGAPARQQPELQKLFITLTTHAERAYQQQDIAAIGLMKKALLGVHGKPYSPALQPAMTRMIDNSEALYINHLGILDQGAFLEDTADHFFRFAAKTIQALSFLSERHQQRLSLAILGTALLAICLTLFLWWQTSLYIKRFLAHQKTAIDAMVRETFDYPLPEVTNDEIGDLALFMKDLATHLQASREKIRQTEARLRLATEEWEKTFDAIGDIVTLQDTEHRIIRVNQAAVKVFEGQADELIGKRCYELFHGVDKPCDDCPIPQTLNNFTTHSAEVVHPNLNKVFWVTSSPLLNEHGKVKGVIHFAKDITELKKLEAQFLQAQKMEAIGRLASGVAHDFNNILTSIMGYSELALLKAPDDPRWRNDVEVIKAAGSKATALVRQLLALSRKQQFEVKAVHLNDLLHNLTKMLTLLIGENISLELKLGEPLDPVGADGSQVEQALLNLVINARDAMPDGGRLTIETANLQIDEGPGQAAAGLEPGSYVRLALRDTGHGMDQETREKIFEPFFTTKEAGKGTGLGLALVFSIISQHKGKITVESERGRGTTFYIFLPAMEGAAKAGADEEKTVAYRHGDETVLVVDDEAAIRALVFAALEPYGYKLIGAGNGEEALAMAAKSEEKINVLLTDIMMPGMGGAELARQFLQRHPDTKVIYMSGYLDAKIIDSFMIDKEKNFLQKPLMPSSLLKKISEILD